MTHHTLARARELAQGFPVSVEVRFEGGDAEKMATAFGNGFPYRPQGEGDLGCRMDRSLAEASFEGAERIVIIGTDCPQITPELIREPSPPCQVRPRSRSSRRRRILPDRPATPRVAIFTDVPWGSQRVSGGDAAAAPTSFPSM